MYGQSKKILTLLITSFITSIVVACILLGEMIRETKCMFLSQSLTPRTSNLLKKLQGIAAPFPDSPGHFCTPTATWPLYYTLWIPLLSFETLLFSLALFKGYQTLRSEVRTGWSGRCVLNILIRDSIMYFFMYAPFSFLRSVALLSQSLELTNKSFSRSLFATYLTNILIWTLGGVSTCPRLSRSPSPSTI